MENYPLPFPLMAVSDAHMQTALVFLVKVNIIKFVLEMRWLNYFEFSLCGFIEQNPGVQRWLHRPSQFAQRDKWAFYKYGESYALIQKGILNH